MSAATCLLGLLVRIPLSEWNFLSYVFCVFVGSGLSDELITRSEESDRLHVYLCVIW